jgi:hypothetical protein
MNSQKAFKKFLVDLNLKFPDIVKSSKLDENDIEKFQELFIGNIVEIIKKDDSIFSESKEVFGIDLSDIFKQDPDLIWKHMQPCLFSSLFHGDIKSKLKDMLPELLGAFKEQFGNTDEIDKILEDESKTSKITEFFEYLKESMFATLLLSVFESIDLSEVVTINPQEFMNDPSKLQQHPIVGKIQGQIQTIMKNKVEKGEFTKERIMNEFEVFKQKIQELFGDYMNETMGTNKSDLPPEIIMGNSPEARRARMLARLQRKLKDRKNK